MSEKSRKINWPWIRIIRIVAAVFLAASAIASQNWLLLSIVGLLVYQLYVDMKCIFCEAGFCDFPDNEKTKE